MSSADYPYAQWFDAPRPCRICGKPAGALMGYWHNNVLAYMCEKHANAEIKKAHRKGDFKPDAVTTTPNVPAGTGGGE